MQKWKSAFDWLIAVQFGINLHSWYIALQYRLWLKQLAVHAAAAIRCMEWFILCIRSHWIFNLAQCAELNLAHCEHGIPNWQKMY